MNKLNTQLQANAAPKQFPGIFYRDNAAMVDIAFTTWLNTDAESIRLYATCKECRYIVIKIDTNQIIFDRVYYGFVNHIVLGFRKPGMYKVNVQIKDGRGYINSYSQKLDIRGLQPNFNIGVIDGVRWPQLVHGKDSLKNTYNAIINHTSKLNIAGMSNATLYRTTRQVMQEAAPNLYVPSIDNDSFEIAKYDATKPGDTKTTYMYKNLSNATTDLLYLNKLQDIRLVDSNSLTLPQYSGTFLELQFDIISQDSIDNMTEGMVADGPGTFELTLSLYKYGPSQTIKFDYDNAQHLMTQLQTAINDTTTTYDMSKHYKFFDDFTWTIRETYINVVLDENDAINPDVGGTVWVLYAMSKTPMSYSQYKYSGKTSSVMLYDNVEYCDNVPSMVTVQLHDNTVQSTTFSITHGLLSNTFADIKTVDDSGNQNLSNLYTSLQKWIADNKLDMQLQKLQVASKTLGGNYETDPLTKFAIYGRHALSIACTDMQFQLQKDVPRLSYDTYFESIEHGAIVTVGSLIVCVPDEQIFAFAPYDLEWAVTYTDNIGNASIVATSVKWLLKYHCRKIGDYTIKLAIIDPMTSKTVQVINKSIVVSKPQN